jgi:hypothetical protein
VNEPVSAEVSVEQADTASAAEAQREHDLVPPVAVEVAAGHPDTVPQGSIEIDVSEHAAAQRLEHRQTCAAAGRSSRQEDAVAVSCEVRDADLDTGITGRERCDERPERQAAGKGANTRRRCQRAGRNLGVSAAVEIAGCDTHSARVVGTERHKRLEVSSGLVEHANQPLDNVDVLADRVAPTGPSTAGVSADRTSGTMAREPP